MRGILAAFALVIAPPALAQDRMALPQCEDVLKVLQAEVPLADMTDVTVSLADDGWCELQGIEVAFAPGTATVVDLARWRASDIGRFLDDGLLPRTLDLEIKGLRSAFRSGDPVQDYLMALTVADDGYDVGLSARWDGIQNALFVDEAYVDFGRTGRIEISARIDEVDLTDVASLQLSMGTAGLRDLSIKADLAGWIEPLLASSVGHALLNDSDIPPAEQVAALQRTAVDWIDTLPDTSVPDQSKIFAADFIMALPRPRGTLQVQTSADPVFGMARILPVLASGDLNARLAAVLDGATILTTWTPRTLSE